MCLCNGTGGIHIDYGWGRELIPCPDTDCEFDKEKADKRYQDWKVKAFEQLGQTKTSHPA